MFYEIHNGVVFAAYAENPGFNPGILVVESDQAGIAAGWSYAGGVFSAPPEPAAAVVPASVSRRQFFQAAAQESIITQVEAIAIFATGAIPANLAAALATMPAADQFATQIAILGNATFERANPLVTELGAAMGQTPAQIDALFTLAASL